jgi:hypothetical protein
MGAGFTIPKECQLPKSGETASILQHINTLPAKINGYADVYKGVIDGSDPTKSPEQLKKIQLNALHENLTNQVNSLKAQISQLKGTIERHNRDFIDIEDATTPNISSVHVMDDVTLWTLLLSYLIFAFAIVFWYSHTHNYSISSILTSVAGMTFISFLLIVLGLIVL